MFNYIFFCFHLYRIYIYIIMSYIPYFSLQLLNITFALFFYISEHAKLMFLFNTFYNIYISFSTFYISHSYFLFVLYIFFLDNCLFSLFKIHFPTPYCYFIFKNSFFPLYIVKNHNKIICT